MSSQNINVLGTFGKVILEHYLHSLHCFASLLKTGKEVAHCHLTFLKEKKMLKIGMINKKKHFKEGSS